MNDIDDSQAPLLDHLVELRRRLLYSVVAVAICFGVCFYFSEQILTFLVKPLLAAGQKRVIFTQIFEAFFVPVSYTHLTLPTK